MPEETRATKRGPASLFRKLGRWARRHKKLTALFVVLVLIAALVLWALNSMQSAAAGLVQPPQTTTLERMDLEQIVSGTGTLQSVAPREVTSSLSYEVAQLYVAEGDFVEAGEVLAELDATELDKSIREVKQSIAEATARDRLALQQAQRKLQEAVDQRDINWRRNEDAVAKAYTAIEAARVAQAQAAGNQAVSIALAAALATDATVTAAQTALTLAQADLTAAETALTLAQTEYEYALASGITTLITEKDTARTTAEGNLTLAKNNLITAENAYNTARAAAETAWRASYESTTYTNAYNEKYNNADVSVQTAAYDAAVQARDTQYRSDTISIQNAQDAVNNQKLQDSADALRTQLEGYEDNKEDCTITAPVAGTVTAMTAAVGKSAGGASSATGASVAGASLFTIENVNALEITASIPEYDAILVQAGMPAAITSDAVSNAEWTGTVNSVSPKATDESGNFTVVVSVTSPVGELAIGMSAKMNIVTDAKAGVFAVPYDAVSTNENGESVVYAYTGAAAQGGEGQRPAMPQSGQLPDMAQGGLAAGEAAGTQDALAAARPIVVQTGMETDYYIEISGEGLTEGMVLLADPEGRNVSTDAGGGVFMMGGRGGGF